MFYIICIYRFFYSAILCRRRMTHSIPEDGSLGDLAINNHKAPLFPPNVQKKRWIILLVFSLNNLIAGDLFMGISSVSSIAAKYYNVSDILIEWTSNSFLVVYIFLALPGSYAIFKLGMQPTLVIASGLNAIATAFHYAGSGQDAFCLVLIGQIIGSIGYSVILQMPSLLSSIWFQKEERGTATAISVFMNLFGVAIGFLHPTLIVTSDPIYKDVISEQFKAYYLSQFIFCFIVFLITMVYSQKEPSNISSLLILVEDEKSYFQYILMLVKNKYFFAMSQSYAINFGLIIAFSVLLNSYVTWKYPSGFEIYIGWMGFVCTIAGIFGCLVVGIVLDKCKKHQCIAIFLNFSSTIMWMAFTLILTKTDSFLGAFIMFSVFGAFGYPYYASGLEQAAEMTYPVPEEISSALILILGSLYGLIFNLVLGYLISVGCSEIALYSMAGLYLLATVIACGSKTELKRLSTVNLSTDQNK